MQSYNPLELPSVFYWLHMVLLILMHHKTLQIVYYKVNIEQRLPSCTFDPAKVSIGNRTTKR